MSHFLFEKIISFLGLVKIIGHIFYFVQKLLMPKKGEIFSKRDGMIVFVGGDFGSTHKK